VRLPFGNHNTKFDLFPLLVGREFLVQLGVHLFNIGSHQSLRNRAGRHFVFVVSNILRDHGHNLACIRFTSNSPQQLQKHLRIIRAQF